MSALRAIVLSLTGPLVLVGCTRTGQEPPLSRTADTSGQSTQLPATGQGPAPAPLELADWTGPSNITWAHTDGSAGNRFIIETVSCGLALFDYDGDGLADIYFCNGAPLPGHVASTPRPRHALYRNLGNWQFQDVSLRAGIDCNAYGLGIAVADYDNDGHPDIYLSNYGPNILYRNNGDGTFCNVTSGELARGARVGAGACFLDLEGDGDLDLLAANYVRFSETTHRAPGSRGRTVYPGPMDYPPETNTLLRNNGDSTWTDVSDVCGIASREGTGMGTVCGDLDGDGDTDIYVANDEMANFLYQNNGRGSFTEVGLQSGTAHDSLGLAHGSMGADCGDFDNDGRLDLYVTAYQHETASLYRNVGDTIFHDVSRVTGASDGTAANVTWGCGLVDLDNDGDRDIFVACGHLDDRDENAVYRAPNLVLRNVLRETGQTRFVNASHECGDGLRVRASSRGAVFGDLDNDGDVDVVVLNSREPPTVLRNLLRENGSPQHHLHIQLRGTRASRDGVGSRVRVVAGPLSLVDEVHSGRGYQSHWGSRLHFGLGASDHVDRVEVHWLGGAIEVWEHVTAGQCVTLVEGTAAGPADTQPPS